MGVFSSFVISVVRYFLSFNHQLCMDLVRYFFSSLVRQFRRCLIKVRCICLVRYLCRSCSVCSQFVSQVCIGWFSSFGLCLAKLFFMSLVRYVFSSLGICSYVVIYLFRSLCMSSFMYLFRQLCLPFFLYVCMSFGRHFFLSSSSSFVISPARSVARSLFMLSLGIAVFRLLVSSFVLSWVRS